MKPGLASAAFAAALLTTAAAVAAAGWPLGTSPDGAQRTAPAFAGKVAPGARSQDLSPASLQK